MRHVVASVLLVFAAAASAAPPRLTQEGKAQGRARISLYRCAPGRHLDFLKWQAAFGSDDSMADGNDDGMVDGLDLQIWVEQFGEAAAAGEGVPEPRGMGILIAGGAALGWATNRRRELFSASA